MAHSIHLQFGALLEREAQPKRHSSITRVRLPKLPVRSDFASTQQSAAEVAQEWDQFLLRHRKPASDSVEDFLTEVSRSAPNQLDQFARDRGIILCSKQQCYNDDLGGRGKKRMFGAEDVQISWAKWSELLKLQPPLVSVGLGEVSGSAAAMADSGSAGAGNGSGHSAEAGDDGSDKDEGGSLLHWNAETECWEQEEWICPQCKEGIEHAELAPDAVQTYFRWGDEEETLSNGR